MSTIRIANEDKDLLKNFLETLKKLTGQALTQGEVIKLLVLFGEQHLSQVAEFLQEHHVLLEYRQEPFWDSDQLNFAMGETNERTHDQQAYRTESR